MIIDFKHTAPLNRYHLMTQTILPRPIAWVLSLNEDFDTAQASALNKTAAPLNYGESEISAAGIDIETFPNCNAPRIKHCPVAFHCRHFDDHDVGNQAVIYAEILQLYIHDENIEEQNKRYIIDAKKLDPLARLGGSDYAGLGNVFSLDRPK